ncbi:hypothetical protein KUTeg_021925, partial [Tegillarca granosa]
MEESPGERMLNSSSNRILELDGIIERQRHGPSGDAALNIPEDTQDFINGMKNENTSRKTDGNVKKWLETKGEHRDVFEIPAPDLNIYLARFFMTIKQDNGQEYEPDTLRSFQGSFQRFLRDHHYPIDIIKDKEFSHSREVLSSKQKQLKKMGYGNKRRKSQPISETDFEVMMGKQVLGLAFEEYKKRRPERMNVPDARFYLQINRNRKDNDPVWYKCQPLGKNYIGGMVKTMAEKAQITDKRLTNHSGRKTTVTRLLDQGFQAAEVMSLTGHKNVQSINNYNTVSEAKQRKMSETLTLAPPRNEASATTSNTDLDLTNSTIVDYGYNDSDLNNIINDWNTEPTDTNQISEPS